MSDALAVFGIGYLIIALCGAAAWASYVFLTPFIGFTGTLLVVVLAVPPPLTVLTAYLAGRV